MKALSRASRARIARGTSPRERRRQTSPGVRARSAAVPAIRALISVRIVPADAGPHRAISVHVDRSRAGRQPRASRERIAPSKVHARKAEASHRIDNSARAAHRATDRRVTARKATAAQDRAVAEAGQGIAPGRAGRVAAGPRENRVPTHLAASKAAVVRKADRKVGSRKIARRSRATPIRTAVHATATNEEEDGSNVTATMVKTEPEGWETPQTILVVLAHPDDPEFFCGATLARWAAQGHTIHYCLLTRGDKGVRDIATDPHVLASTREVEQRGAADVIGVKDLVFLDFEDGYLVPDLSARRKVTRAIRAFKPDIVMSCDPTYIFGEANINHPDHRAAGQIVVDAVFPAAGNPMYFPDLITEDGFEPHAIRELWLSVTGSPNVTIDVTTTWEQKIRALHCHVTQIADMNALDERMRGRHTPDSTLEAPRYEEKFRRFKFR